jgi:hypothetical protein
VVISAPEPRDAEIFFSDVCVFDHRQVRDEPAMR